MESDLKRRREEKTRREKDRSDLDKVFAKVNAAVAAGSSSSSSSGGGSYNNNFGVRKPWEQPIIQYQPHVKPEKSSSSSNDVSLRPVKQTPPLGSSSSLSAAAAMETTPDVNAGHYNIEGTSYLDGYIFATILEEGMPIQLWMGDPNASDAEKRDLRSLNNWKMALLAKVVRKRNNPGGTTSSNVVDTATTSTTTNTLCHVSYLQNSNDNDETLETNVPPARIRLVLGSDPLIPSTLEEAHLALLGGEQIIQVAEGSNDGAAQQQQQQIDENTGLSTWSTTAIRKVSSHYEQNQERKRKREHEKELAEYKKKKEKELKARMMEEAKYANAHDSALGAYDVWSSSAASAVEGKTAAYKGVDINKETKVEVLDTAKSLSKGMGNVAFKKKKVNKKSIRRTSADDDN